jgi:uncharacterized cupredoxin-like copper-binding protein
VGDEDEYQVSSFASKRTLAQEKAWVAQENGPYETYPNQSSRAPASVNNGASRVPASASGAYHDQIRSMAGLMVGEQAKAYQAKQSSKPSVDSREFKGTEVKAPSQPTHSASEVSFKGISEPDSESQVGSADPVTRQRGVQEVSVIANELGFFPKTIFVSRDVPVRLYVTSTTKSPTCVMMDAFNIRKQVKQNKVEEIAFVPEAPGQYRFYCPVNGSEGTLVVKEFVAQDARSIASSGE